MTSQVRLTSFYGSNVARPYLVFNDKGEEVKDRLEKPSANAPLLDWASKAPFKAGGSFHKLDSYKGKPLPKARNEFLIFSEAQRSDILASNPHLLNDPDQKGFRTCASLYWAEKLSDEERQKYKDLAAAERKAAQEAIEALAAADPAFKSYVEKKAASKLARIAANAAAKPSEDPNHKLTKKRKSRVKLPEALKLKKITYRPTKHYKMRSKKFTANKPALTLAEKEAVLFEETSEEEEEDMDVEGAASESESESEEEEEEEFADASEEIPEEPNTLPSPPKKASKTTPSKALKSTSKSAGEKTVLRKRGRENVAPVASLDKVVKKSEAGNEYSGEFALPSSQQEKRMTRAQVVEAETKRTRRKGKAISTGQPVV